MNPVDILYKGKDTVFGILDIPVKTKFDKNMNGPMLSQWSTYGNHLYRAKGEKAEVVFLNKKKGIRKTIVNNNGRIINFPGIADLKKVLSYMERKEIKPVIRFETSFEKVSDDRIMMIWEVQPDGMYWADDSGFGGENDLEVRLYTYLDEKGNFTGPFRLYNVGSESFKTADR